MSPRRARAVPPSARRPFLALLLATLAGVVAASEATARSTAPPPPAALRGDTTGTLRGVAVDSLLGGPLADATVTVAPIGSPAAAAAAPPTARTDSLGRFVVDGLAPGAWRVTLTHPALDSAGLWDGVAATATIGRGGDTAVVRVATPSAAALRQRLCLGQTMDVPVARDARVREVILYGVVRDVRSDAPVPGAVVQASWLTDAARRGPDAAPALMTTPRWLAGEAIADGAGVWALCLRGDGDELTGFVVRAHAAPGADSLASGRLGLLAGSRGVRRLDLAVAPPIRAAGDTTRAAGTDPASLAPIVARLEGVVRDTLGRAVAGARLALGDEDDEALAPDTARSDAEGRVRLGARRLGTQPLTVRALGHGVWREPVVLVPGRTTTVTVALARIQRLPTVVVRESPWRARIFRQIDDRKRVGLGFAVDSTWFAQFAGRSLWDAFNGWRGIMPAGPCAGGLPMGLTARGGRGGRVAVWLDDWPDRVGALVAHCDVRPEDIGYVEYFGSREEVPPQYCPRGDCPSALLLVWTKGFLADPRRGTRLLRASLAP